MLLLSMYFFGHSNKKRKEWTQFNFKTEVKIGIIAQWKSFPCMYVNLGSVSSRKIKKSLLNQKETV